jgi:hypothetical protein
VAKTVLHEADLEPFQQFMILRDLMRVLWDQDWDCEDDSPYWNDPMVRRARSAFGHQEELLKEDFDAPYDR